MLHKLDWTRSVWAGVFLGVNNFAVVFRRWHLAACILLNEEHHPILTILNRWCHIQFELWFNISKKVFCCFCSAVWASLLQKFLIAAPTNKMTTIIANCCMHTFCLITKTACKIRVDSKSFRVVGFLSWRIVSCVLNLYEWSVWQQN